MKNWRPVTTGRQFFIANKHGSDLNGDNTIFGRVTKCLEIVEKSAAAGVGESGQSTTDGPPKTDVVIQSLTVSTPATPAPTSEPTSTPTSTPSATTQS